MHKIPPLGGAYYLQILLRQKLYLPYFNLISYSYNSVNDIKYFLFTIGIYTQKLQRAFYLT